MDKMAGRQQKFPSMMFKYCRFLADNESLLNVKKISGIGFLCEGMTVSHWNTGQGEWSTVGQCEEAKTGFVILYSQRDMAKCLSEDTLGHFCSTNK